MCTEIIKNTAWQNTLQVHDSDHLWREKKKYVTYNQNIGVFNIICIVCFFYILKIWSKYAKI